VQLGTATRDRKNSTLCHSETQENTHTSKVAGTLLADTKLLRLFTAHNPPYINTILDGFGDLVVSMLASGTRVRGLKPG